jgi:hypothetical protein
MAPTADDPEDPTRAPPAYVTPSPHGRPTAFARSNDRDPNADASISVSADDVQKAFAAIPKGPTGTSIAAGVAAGAAEEAATARAGKPGKTEAGTSIAGAAVAVKGLYDGIKNGDKAQTALASGNLATSVATATVEVTKATSRGVTPALEGAIGKANIVLTVADGVYQISREDSLRHKVQRSGAVATTTGLGLTLGAAGASVSEGAALTGALGTTGAAAAVAAAPLVLTGAAVMATAYTMEAAIRTARAYEALDKTREEFKATKLDLDKQPGAAPNVYEYKNLPAVMGDICKNIRDDHLGRQVDRNTEGRIKNPRQLNLNDPKTLAEYGRALDMQIEQEKTVVKENSSWIPRWIQWGEKAETFENAQTVLAQLKAARDELTMYKSEVKEYRSKAATITAAETTRHQPQRGSTHHVRPSRTEPGVRDPVLDGGIRGKDIRPAYQQAATAPAPAAGVPQEQGTEPRSPRPA